MMVGGEGFEPPTLSV